MYQTYPAQFNPSPPGVQPQVVFVTQVPVSRPPAKYSERAATRALRLSWIQILSGIASLSFQAVATGFQKRFVRELDRTYYYLDLGHADLPGTGLWVGVLMFICGAVGILAAKKNHQGKIGAHLGLNIVMLIITPVLMGTASSSIADISDCFERSNPFSYSFYFQTSSTFLGWPVSNGCHTPFFNCWLAMVCLLLIIAVGNFIVALILLVMNSKVMCCGSCCNDNVTQMPAQQVLYSAGYTPGQPYIVPPGYATPYAPSFYQTGQPPHYSQHQWPQTVTNIGPMGAHANPPASEEKSGSPPPSYDEQMARFAATTSPPQQI